MSRDRFVVLARYNAWANARIYAACAELSEAEYKADHQAFFGSIHGTLNHVLVGDKLWMGRLTGEMPDIASLDTVLYEDFDQLRAAREAEDAHIISHVQELTADDLNAVLVYRTMAGEANETPVHWVLTHMLNHATHHRGQAHGLLSQVPADPPPLDLIYFLRESGITA